MKTIQEAMQKEQEFRTQEAKEIRAILDAVWKEVSIERGEQRPDDQEMLVRSAYYYRTSEGGTLRYKECVGDADDIVSLYQLVREALGDSVRLDQAISEERKTRRDEMASLK